MELEIISQFVRLNGTFMKCYNFFISWCKIDHGLHGNVTVLYVGVLRIESCLMDEIARKLVPANSKSVGRNIEIDYCSGKPLGFPSIISAK